MSASIIKKNSIQINHYLKKKPSEIINDPLVHLKPKHRE